MKKGIVRHCFVASLLICLTISIISPNIALAQPATFTDSGQALGSASSYDVALGDLDSDGDLDAFVANYGQANRVWNNGAHDYGDAPAPYPTADAYHIVDISTYLGSAIDPECQALPNDDATGDDNNNLADEDGVSFDTSMVLCQQADITVTASEAGFLNTWIDFNTDGDWDDANERVFDNYPLSSGPNLLSFTVPCHAVAGETFARFRFSTDNSINSYNGYAPNGEIEDYKTRILLPGEEEEKPEEGMAVGGDIYPINKMALLTPWLILSAAIIAAGIVLLRRRAHN